MQSITLATRAFWAPSTLVRGPAAAGADYFYGIEQHSPAHPARNRRRASATKVRGQRRTGVRVYPDGQAAAAANDLLSAIGARNRLRLPSGRGKTTERQSSFPPHCGQHHTAGGGATAAGASGGALRVKPCANSMRPFTSATGMEKLGERKPK